MKCGLKQLDLTETGTSRHQSTFRGQVRLKTMPMNLIFISLLFLTSAGFSQSATTPPNPCTAAQQKQFDFWVGEWDLTWPAQNGGVPGHGTNNIKRILDQCIVQENFSSLDGSNLLGTSLSVYDLPSNHWKQTWVDNQGGYLDFVGDFQNGQMILQREAKGKDGKPFLQRMVWKNVTSNEFDWSWESSKDDGKTWQVNWPIHYKRKA